MRNSWLLAVMLVGACDAEGTAVVRWPHHRQKSDHLAKEVEADSKQLVELSAKVDALSKELDAERRQLAELTAGQTKKSEPQ